jgi:hypothetical protein
MNDYQFHRVKNKLQKYLKTWKVLLGLQWYRLDVLFDRDSIRRPDPENPGGTIVTYATTSCSYEYLQAAIQFSVPGLQDKDDADLERVVIHELLHVVVNEMRDASRSTKHEERVVSVLEEVFFKLQCRNEIDRKLGAKLRTRKTSPGSRSRRSSGERSSNTS